MMRGFHHDYLGKLEQTGAIRVEVVNRSAGGFYEAKVQVVGMLTNPPKAFFPQHWTRQEVVMCISETYQKCIQQNILPEIKPGGGNLLKAKIGDWIELYFHIDDKVNNIKSVYPVITGNK